VAEHVAKFVKERARVGLAIEIAVLPTPVGPGSGQPVEYLGGLDFAAITLGFVQRVERIGVGIPVLRKYFWARTSQATCDQLAGTSTSFSSKTTEPLGFLISLNAVRNSIPSYGEVPSRVK
jgi:hypothetical protein